MSQPRIPIGQTPPSTRHPYPVRRPEAYVAGPPRGGRTLIIGTLIVGAGIALFYSNLFRRQHKKEQKDELTKGVIPTWQQRVLQSPSENFKFSKTLRASLVESRNTPVAAPKKEHDAHHTTIQEYLSRPDSTWEGRIQQPAPQRGKSDGSGLAYTKSTSYFDGYKSNPERFRQKKMNVEETPWTVKSEAQEFDQEAEGDQPTQHLD